MDNLKRWGTGGGILAAVVMLVVGLLNRAEVLITDEMISETLVWVATSIVFCLAMILSWIIAALLVEAHKHDRILPDFNPDPDAEPSWKGLEARREIRKWATVYGGSIMTFFMLWWWTAPDITPWRVAFCFLFGYSAGGLALPYVYKLGLYYIVPWLMVRCGFKLVRRSDGSDVWRPENTTSDPGDKTIFKGPQ
jgi:fumarate reductase subunit D